MIIQTVSVVGSARGCSQISLPAWQGCGVLAFGALRVGQVPFRILLPLTGKFSALRLHVCVFVHTDPPISQPGSIALPFLSRHDWRCLTMVPAVPHRHDLIGKVAIAANSGFSLNTRRSAERFCLIGSHDVTVMECASFRRWLLTELGCAVPAAQTAALSDCRRSQLCCETQSSVERFNLGAGLFSLLPSSLPPTSTLWR